MEIQDFDIILTGTGMSGLMLATELSRRPFFSNSRLLLLDRDTKEKNDRTWCFWASDAEDLPPVVHRSWDACVFYNQQNRIEMQIAPYRYRMVRGGDFYNWSKAAIGRNPQVTWIHTDIRHIDPESGVVQTDAGVFRAPLIFNSALLPARVVPDLAGVFQAPFTQPDKAPRGYKLLYQHFKGWIIETAQPAFNPDAMTFMDFRVDQQGNTRFVYVLPFSPTRALVEYTLFSPALLTPEQYDEELRTYIGRFLQLNNYRVLEDEYGIIPMTDFPFASHENGKVIHIGTAGGFVKGSSGYAFKHSWRAIRTFLDAWEQTGKPSPGQLRRKKRFQLYDQVLLQVLQENNELGGRVFSSLFEKLPASLVFRFLDEDTTLLEDLRILTAVPRTTFTRAALTVLSKHR